MNIIFLLEFYFIGILFEKNFFLLKDRWCSWSCESNGRSEWGWKCGTPIIFGQGPGDPRIQSRGGCEAENLVLVVILVPTLNQQFLIWRQTLGSCRKEREKENRKDVETIRRLHKARGCRQKRRREIARESPGGLGRPGASSYFK